MIETDARAFFELNSHPEVMRYTGESPLASVAEAREAIVNYPDFETIGYGRWGCFLRGSDTLIGFCGLKYLTDLDAVDVGYRLLPQYWGRGLATEACTASVGFGFEILRLDRIIGLVRPQNIASRRVLEKAGMRQSESITLDGQSALLYEISATKSGHRRM